MNPSLENLSTELIKAVNLILNPCVPNSQRLEAHKVSFFHLNINKKNNYCGIKCYFSPTLNPSKLTLTCYSKRSL